MQTDFKLVGIKTPNINDHKVHKSSKKFHPKNNIYCKFKHIYRKIMHKY
jgi:hypothetical protein